MRFKDWLKKLEEVSTDTGDIAVFARPIFSGNWRMYPDPVIDSTGTSEDSEDKKKKSTKK